MLSGEKRAEAAGNVRGRLDNQERAAVRVQRAIREDHHQTLPPRLQRGLPFIA